MSPTKKILAGRISTATKLKVGKITTAGIFNLKETVDFRSRPEEDSLCELVI